MRDKGQTIHDKNSEDSILDRYIDEISSSAPLTSEEERTLSAQIKAGSERAKEKLIRANLMFVVSIARQYAASGVAMLDLIGEGNIALIKAAGKFDASKGKRFTQFAVWDIRKAIEAFIPKDEVRMNRTVADHLPGKGNTADSTASENTDKETMALTLARLPEREQMVLRAYFGIGEEQMTMAEIGEANGLKRERVRQIRNRALRRLRRIGNR